MSYKHTLLFSIPLWVCLIVFFMNPVHVFPASLLPVPKNVEFLQGNFPITSDFTAVIDATQPMVYSSRAANSIQRMFARLAGRTGIFFKRNDIQLVKNPTHSGLRVSFKRIGKIMLNEDESYSLNITSEGVRLLAETDIGIIRGLETLLQLLSNSKEGYYFPAVTITDQPRFVWRGLLIDSCRHFLPLDVIKRNLDGMAAVKLNVLHWHLSEDQGFRVECKALPKLHQLAADGLYYTQAQIREIISYAAERGIRVMPEFDIPGHSTSWLTAYPELASAPGPYALERKYGVFDPTFDPTNKAVYHFFATFFKEMAALFSDEYMHIGGDENNGKQWDNNPSIQMFKKKHHLADNHALHAFFNGKILKILTKYKKKMVGWDEIFQPSLPNSIIIHSWRGKEALQAAAQKGYNSILSNGYYIDLCQSAEYHYLNDPIPTDSSLTATEQKRVLGGEATMWAELVTAETIDSRIWPRTAAIAERLWSPGTVKDVEDMYRRLDVIGLQLEELGLLHYRNQGMMLRRLAAGPDIAALQVLVDVIEPLKKYARHGQLGPYTFYSPFTRVVDAAFPESRRARIFRHSVTEFVKAPRIEKVMSVLEHLELWRDNHEKLQVVINRSPVLAEIAPMSLALSQLATLAIDAVQLCLLNNKAMPQWLDACGKIIAEAKKPKGHAELAIVSGIEELLNACK